MDDRRHVNLLLREANIALSSRNDALFQLCILKMLDWFERSVLLDTNQIQAILRDIQSLQDIQLRPNLPNIRQESALTAQLIVELQLNCDAVALIIHVPNELQRVCAYYMYSK